MGKQVSVYVRDDDLPLWERAERYARKNRMPVSGLIMAALEAYLDDKRGTHSMGTPRGDQD